jgi:hypothetical protein
MRFVVVTLIVVLGLPCACGPTSTSQSHHRDDDWERAMQPEITGDNAKDEARWRRDLASDPWGDDSALLLDDPPKSAAEYQGTDEDIPPLDFVGPPEPPSTWDNMQKGSTKFGKIFFSILTVFVTLGMMAAPYLMMM